MSPQLHCPKVNFTFSQAAFVAIEKLKADWPGKLPGDEPDVLSVSWGEFYFNNGARDERVIVSFYTRDQRAEMEQHIQHVQGREVIFFTLDKFARHFDGKVIDYSDTNFFFLRKR